MSIYEPLKRHLLQLAGSEAPMTFREVEAILGFELPYSARNYPAWWSNNVGTHVNAAAWREAGWKTSRVDLGKERVTFIRGHPAARETGAPFIHKSAQPSQIVVPVGSLSRTTLRMIDDWVEETGLDRAGAVVALLEAAATARRKELLKTMPVARMPVGHDSTALIREDRETR